MTDAARRLQCPAIGSQTMAVRRTARAHHAYDLADAANDAATGHPAQRATVLRNVGGTFHLLYDPRSTAFLLSLAITAAWRGDWTFGEGVKPVLSIDDGTTTVAYSHADIPRGLKSDRTFMPALAASRFEAMARAEWHLDKGALVTAGLSPTAVWRFTLGLLVGASAVCELVELAEVSRFGVSDTGSYGAIPHAWQPRTPIDDRLVQIGRTLEAAYDLNRRTYHHVAVDEADALLVTDVAFAAIPGIVQSESTGVPTVWRVHPRRIRGEPRVRFGCVYKTSGADDGYLRLSTGGAGSPYDLTLPGTSGTWAHVTTGVGYLADEDVDALRWEAQASAGTLSLATLWCVDDPT